MDRTRPAEAKWAAGVAAVLGALLLAPTVVALLAAFLLAAAWSIRIDREDHAVQLLASDEVGANR